MAGYVGVVPESLLPAITPAETAIFLGAAAFTTGAGPEPMPPRTPPITPPVPPAMPSMPATPEFGGGAASSLMSLIVCGILVGAIGWLFSTSEATFTLMGAAGGGGGGGGG